RFERQIELSALLEKFGYISRMGNCGLCEAAGPQLRKASSIPYLCQLLNRNFAIGWLVEVSDGLDLHGGCPWVVGTHNGQGAVHLVRELCDILRAHNKPSQHPRKEPGSVLEEILPGRL